MNPSEDLKCFEAQVFGVDIRLLLSLDVARTASIFSKCNPHWEVKTGRLHLVDPHKCSIQIQTDLGYIAICNNITKYKKNLIIHTNVSGYNLKKTLCTKVDIF